MSIFVGDVTLSAEDMSLSRLHYSPTKPTAGPASVDYEDEDDDFDIDEDDFYAQGGEEEEHHDWFVGSTAAKFLLAGGIAGAGQCRHVQHVMHTN